VPGYVACIQALAVMDFRASNASITAPTLIIAGAKDVATTPADGEAIQKEIKGAKLVALDAAHISNVEQPKQYTETVLNFLLG
jgi:3-oxoadipate enol-lactonase